GLDQFSQRAFDLVLSERARTAFDVSLEAAAVRTEFGPHPFGQKCLLAARLIEAGVRFATVTSVGGWDTLIDNFNRLRTTQLPPFDAGVSALINRLHGR